MGQLWMVGRKDGLDCSLMSTLFTGISDDGKGVEVTIMAFMLHCV